MKILFKYASRTRADKFFEGLDSIVKNLDNDNYSVLVTYDEDDGTMNNEEVLKRLSTYKNITLNPGISNNKIHAINRGMDLAGDFDILVCMSDDMRFIKKRFDETIRQDFQNCFPDLDGCLHYPDQNQYANCMTMSIMGRKYYERFNFIYHPSYESLWSDLEAQEVAQRISKYKYMGDSARIFDHYHPSFGQAPYDDQYRKTEAMEVRSKDEQNYLTRKANNFYISGK